jgi:hypothetical protein
MERASTDKDNNANNEEVPEKSKGEVQEEAEVPQFGGRNDGSGRFYCNSLHPGVHEGPWVPTRAELEAWDRSQEEARDRTREQEG